MWRPPERLLPLHTPLVFNVSPQGMYGALSSEHLKVAKPDDFHSILGEWFVLSGALVNVMVIPTLQNEKNRGFMSMITKCDEHFF